MQIGKLRASRETLALVVLALFATAIWLRVFHGRPEEFQAVFIDVGHGDCIFLRTPSGKNVLVDGGGSEGVGTRTVEPYLRRAGVNRIDLLVLTHPHYDHVRGLIPIVRHFSVGMMLDPKIAGGDADYDRLVKIAAERKIPVKRALRGESIDFGDGVQAFVLNPGEERLSEINNDSVVLRFTYKEWALLLTGDAETPAEEKMLRSGMALHADVLKLAHHGSERATGAYWLDAVQPRIAVVSLGKRNAFGHPSPAVIGRLSERGIAVYRTDQDGNVTVRFGHDLSVSAE
ncbi:MAG: ComEC/Rec2 family competence protein [Armatimonadota bacterium]